MRRKGIKIMGNLIGLVKPLLHVMVVAVLLGVVGFLCAMAVTVGTGYAIAELLGYSTVGLKSIVVIIAVSAVLRGILHYGEQACNHYIAFKLLALIRTKVFNALRRLAPAKMESKKKGELIAVLTSDIELLEVFYAHTISPIAIAILTSVIVLCIIGSFNLWLMVVALLGYVTVGGIIPVVMGKKGSVWGMKYRNDFAELNSIIYDSLRGVDEIIQYGYGEKRYKLVEESEDKLNLEAEKLRRLEGIQKGITGGAILLFTLLMLVVSIWLNANGSIDFNGVLICTIIMTSSFGPLVALSNLSNNLSQTLASGERVLEILEEAPVIEDITGKMPATNGDVKADNVTFSYEEELILKDVDMEFKKGQITGILGKSGSGKSTLLKLIMRFWETDKGQISIDDRDVNDINTEDLRDMQSYVTQETWLFNDTIGNNIKIAKPYASLEEVKKAAKKANIADFIENLPNGYDTNIGELGDSLSGGEKQRIGVARAFLHDSNMIILDEPTSNLDSLNESYLLNSLENSSKDKTVILVSHRASTMGIANKVYKIDHGRKS